MGITTPEAVSKLLTTPIPERLWHYTSFLGFKSIVESNSIYASDIRFLNDSQELIHARHLLKEIAHDERAKFKNFSSDAIDKAFTRPIDLLFEEGPLNSKHLQVFVACFSESRDQLSQWRGYSHRSSGISLGLDLREFRQHLGREMMVFAPCVYEDDEKRALLLEIVKDLFSRAIDMVRVATSAGRAAGEKASGTSGEVPEQFDDWFAKSPEVPPLKAQYSNSQMSAAYALLRAAALMKHSSFREEREWRLVMPILTGFNDANVNILFGSGSSTLIPRLSQSLSMDFPPVREVVLGPGSHSFSADAVKQFLRCQKLESIVEMSGVPYRPND